MTVTDELRELESEEMPPSEEDKRLEKAEHKVRRSDVVHAKICIATC